MKRFWKNTIRKSISATLAIIMTMSFSLPVTNSVGIDTASIGQSVQAEPIDISSDMNVVPESSEITIGGAASQDAAPSNEINISDTQNEITLDADSSISSAPEMPENQTVSSEISLVNSETSEITEHVDEAPAEQTEITEKEELNLTGETNIQETRASYFTETESELFDFDGMDFASMRLIVIAAEDAIIDKENIMSSYNGLYLMQYLTVEQAKNAYVYYSTHAEHVSVDIGIETAEESSTAENAEGHTEEITEQTEDNTKTESSAEENKEELAENNTDANTENTEQTDIASEGEIALPEAEAEPIIAEDGMSTDENPLSELAKEIEVSSEISLEEDKAEPEKKEEKPKVIALLDTGVMAGEHIIERVSMLGESVEDDNGHGNTMAGYILEENPDARIISVKVLDNNGKGTISSVYAGMEYAIYAGADIINMSMSAYCTEENSVLEEIINRAAEQGITVVGSAGNNGMDAAYFVPGKIEKAVIVGACDAEGNKVATSNYGETVDGYITAGSTSEAAARYSGRFSKMDSSLIQDVNIFDNQVSPDESGEFSTQVSYTLNKAYQAANGTLVSTISNNTDDYNGANYTYIWGTVNAGAMQNSASYNNKAGYHPVESYAKYISNSKTPTGLTVVIKKIKMDDWNTAYDRQINGGSGSTYLYNAVQNASSGFADWSSTESANYYVVARFSRSSASTGSATVTWRLNVAPNTYTVVYDGNGATGGSTASSSHTYDTPKALTANGFTRTGYIFKGWNTKADGTGTGYSNSQSVSNLTTTDGGTVTLYAQWMPTYTVNYVLGGGTFQHAYNYVDGAFQYNPTTVYYDNSQFTPNNNATTRNSYFQVDVPTKPGAEFIGWKITGMDTSVHQYWVNSPGPGSVSFSTASLDMSDPNYTYYRFNPPIKAFMHLRNSPGTVTFTAVWDSLPFPLYNSFWAGGFTNGEGNNDTNNMFRLDSDLPNTTPAASNTFDETNALVYTANTGITDYVRDIEAGTAVPISRSRAMSTPNGFELYTAWVSDGQGTRDIEDTFEMPSQSTILEYHYRPVTYSITYNMQPDATNNPSNPTEYNVLYGKQLFKPTRPGYIFTGWKDQSGVIYWNNDTDGTNDYAYGINYYNLSDASTKNDNSLFINSFSNSDNFYLKMSKRRSGDLILTPRWRKEDDGGEFVNDNSLKLPNLVQSKKNEGKFKIVETRQTDGYILNTNEYFVDLNTAIPNGDGQIELTIENDPNEVIIMKTDASSGEAVGGAKFQVWHENDTANSFETETSTADVDADGDGVLESVKGQAIVKRLAPGTWSFKEIEAPAGYKLDNNTYTITVSQDGKIFGQTSYTLNIKNVKDDEDFFTIRKISSDNDPMEGVTFRYYENYTSDAGSWTPIVTGADGTVTVGPLTVGQTYAYKEQSLPAQYSSYIMDTTTYQFRVNADHSITQVTKNITGSTATVINQTNKLIIRKTDNGGNVLNGAVIKIYKDGSIYDTVTLTNGVKEYKALPNGTYTYEETTAPTGYAAPSGQQALCVVANNRIDGTFEKTINIQNPPTQVTLLKKSNTGAVLANAKFRIKCDSVGYDEIHITDTSGQISLTGLKHGTYSFYEVEPAPGYMMTADASGTFTISQTGAVTYNYKQGTNLINTPNKVIVYKTDAAGTKLPNVVFSFTYTGTHTNPFAASATRTTNTNGEITLTQLPPGAYTYVETSVPNGIVLDETIHKFTVNSLGEIETDASDTALEARPDANTVKYTIINHRRATMTLVVNKTGIAHDGTNPLSGAEFKLYKGTTEIGTLTDQHNGTYKITGIDVEPYETTTFTVKETSNAVGYVMNYEKEFSVTATSENPVVDTVVTVSEDATNDENGVKLRKIDKKSRAPLSGVVFQLKKGTTVIASLTTNNDGWIEYYALAEGDYTLTEYAPREGYDREDITLAFTVNDDGTLSKEGETTSSTLLIFDEVENTPPATPHDVKITKRGLNNKLLTGAVFQLQEWNGSSYTVVNNPFIDNGDGTYSLRDKIKRTYGNAGKFKIVETRAPLGYVSDWVQEFVIEAGVADDYEYSFEATNTPTTLTVQKVLTTTYETNRIAAKSAVGTVFSFGADTNTQQRYGTDYTYYETKEYTIDAGNTLTFPELYDGVYVLKELRAPSGFVLSSSPVNITVQNGKIQGETQYTMAYNNEGNYFRVFKKGPNGEAVAGANFVLTNMETGQTWTAVSGADGYCVIASLLPDGEYSLDETSVPAPYIKNSSSYYFSVEDGKIIEEVNDPNDNFDGLVYEQTAQEGGEGKARLGVKNIKEVIGSVRIRKVNGSGTNLEGAVFGVYEYNAATGSYEGTLIPDGTETYTDDDMDDGNGNIIPGTTHVEQLYKEVPKYTLTYSGGYYTKTDLRVTESNQGMFEIREIEAPDGYFADFNQYINITQQQDWNITATNPPASFSIYKMGEEELEPLEGAIFKVWNDVDGETNATNYTTNASGLFTINSVHKNTTYHLKEIKAPKGYDIIRDVKTIEIGPDGGVYGKNNATITMMDEKGGLRKLIINCIIDRSLPQFEDISFIYDVNGVNELGETSHFCVIITPDTLLTDAQVAKYTSELNTRESKIHTSLCLTLPAGDYTVTQRKAQRYKLNEVKGEREGSTEDGLTIKCDLNNYEVGEGTFVNILRQYNMAASASMKINHIGNDYEDLIENEYWNPIDGVTGPIE